jgi:Ser/Thr protein kinase RdoA (MazF antagonist)
MTATSARLPSTPDGLLEAVAARYDGAPFALLGRLSGGWANDVFLAESARGRVVVRVKHAPAERASVAWEHDLVGRLAAELPEVVVPLRARDGSTFFPFGGAAVWVLPYVDGRPAERDAHRGEAARVLARLHRVGSRLDMPPRPGCPGLGELRSLDAATLRAEWRERVRRHHERALALLDDLERRPLACGVVHGDFYRGNVLVRGDAVVGLIDWEEAHVAPLVVDLANAVWEFAKRKNLDDFDRGAGAIFVNAYRQARGPVPPHDDDLIAPLIHARRVLELLRAASDSDADWSYQAHNLRAAARLA